MKKIIILVLMYSLSQYGLAFPNEATTETEDSDSDDDSSIYDSGYGEESPEYVIGGGRHNFKRNVYNRLSFTSYILSEKVAMEGQFPYQVSLRTTTDNTHFCGGTIISTKYVVTAASCICGNIRGRKKLSPENLLVAAGVVNLNDPKIQEFQVHEIKCHNKWDPTQNHFNDIALIQIKDKFHFIAFIRPLSISWHSISDNIPVIISGWGSSSENFTNREFSDDLQFGETYAIGYAECKRVLKVANFTDMKNTNLIVDKYINPTVGCTYRSDRQNGPNLRWKDLGGPVAHNGILIGIISWFFHTPPVLETFTNVAHFYKWIGEETGSLLLRDP